MAGPVCLHGPKSSEKHADLSVAVGDSESEIMKMIAQLPKETDKV